MRRAVRRTGVGHRRRDIPSGTSVDMPIFDARQNREAYRAHLDERSAISVNGPSGGTHATKIVDATGQLDWVYAAG